MNILNDNKDFLKAPLLEAVDYLDQLKNTKSKNYTIEGEEDIVSISSSSSLSCTTEWEGIFLGFVLFISSSTSFKQSTSFLGFFCFNSFWTTSSLSSSLPPQLNSSFPKIDALHAKQISWRLIQKLKIFNVLRFATG